jgi:hypothetical protein
MNTKCPLTLALAAGFIGGLTSRYCGPAPVYAQSPPSPPEIRAQKFILIDENGVARGVFGIEKNGAPEVEIIDSKGRVFATVFTDWSAQHGFLAASFVPGPKKPTLLPIKP